MKFKFVVFIVVLLFTGSLMASELQTYGYVEKIILVDKNLPLHAKLDTGAKSASLNATRISQIDIKGQPYIRFTVPTERGDVVFEAKSLGKVKIKMRAQERNLALAETPYIKRPVVLLQMQLGDKLRNIRVNLTNRKRFLYPLLLGRDAIMEFNGAVNPALTFTVKSKSS